MNEELTPRRQADRLLEKGSIQVDAWIDGEPFAQGERFARHSPIDGNVVSSIVAADETAVDRAVQAAKQAFDAGVWRLQSVEERQSVLARFAELIGRDADSLALMETLENGMPYRMCRFRNITESQQCFRWFGDAVGKQNDESLWLDEDNFAAISREPVGVVAAIVPWNFPMMITAWKLAPALAVGCSVVVKPSEQCGAAISRLGALSKEAGFPDGVFNVVPGRGEEAGAALVKHKDVNYIAFTGSTQVGKEIMAGAATNLKRVGMECGGKTAVIVLDDATDENFTAAIQAATQAFFRHQGQICNAGSRLLVPEKRLAAAGDIARQVAESLRIGDPLSLEHDFGPVIDSDAVEHSVAAARRATEEGAQLLTGGRRVLSESGGNYVAPTVLLRVTPAMQIAQKEVFGPVLSIMPFQDDNEAVQIANGTDYGLGACLFTGDLSRAHRLARRLRAGHVLVNKAAGASLRLPFGGFKESGFGRDKSMHALTQYTELKATTFNLG